MTDSTVTIDSEDRELFLLMKDIVDHDFPDELDIVMNDLLKTKKRTYRIEHDPSTGKVFIDFPRKKSRLSFLGVP